MTYYAQNFKSPAAMDRVCAWLVRLGFRPSEIHATHKHVPSLFIATDWARAESIQQVVDALLDATPDDIPSVWDRPAVPGPRLAEDTAPPAAHPRSGPSPIHWECRTDSTRHEPNGLGDADRPRHRFER